MMKKRHSIIRTTAVYFMSLLLALSCLLVYTPTAWAANPGYWKLIQSPESKIVNFPNGSSNTKLEYNGGSVDVTQTDNGNIKEHKILTLKSPVMPERINPGEELEFTVESSAMTSPTIGVLTVYGGGLNDGFYVGRSELTTSKRIKFYEGSLDKNDLGGHYISVFLKVSNQDTASGNGDGKIPAWVYEWTAAPAAAKVVKLQAELGTVTMKFGTICVNKLIAVLSDGTTQDVTKLASLSSKNTKVVRILQDGNFQAVKKGTVKILVEYKGCMTTFTVKVK